MPHGRGPRVIVIEEWTGPTCQPAQERDAGSGTAVFDDGGGNRQQWEGHGVTPAQGRPRQGSGLEQRRVKKGGTSGEGGEAEAFEDGAGLETASLAARRSRAT
ncbi:hypothetical protein E2562_010582 [Oryza meyeriana var. granulata]|uniref:DUF834 domain-containing protein n=1 Tax=Oryza meyeriana var. granulata TaxID=110450 RepID=A0A6G1BV06_9ORYZ|nr:hypothetical protein E2562_010582 [Oryza meyeriana var. granulata]